VSKKKKKYGLCQVLIKQQQFAFCEIPDGGIQGAVLVRSSNAQPAILFQELY
jgi:hypothetical protein